MFEASQEYVKSCLKTNQKQSQTKPLILKAVDIGYKQKSLGPRLRGPEFQELRATSCAAMGKPFNVPEPQCCEEEAKELHHVY